MEKGTKKIMDKVGFLEMYSLMNLIFTYGSSPFISSISKMPLPPFGVLLGIAVARLFIVSIQAPVPVPSL